MSSILIFRSIWLAFCLAFTLALVSADIFDYNPLGESGKKFKIFGKTNVQRFYHGNAVLIPDGRVLIMASDQITYNFTTAYGHIVEAFTPPWLLDGSYRPEILR